MPKKTKLITWVLLRILLPCPARTQLPSVSTWYGRLDNNHHITSMKGRSITVRFKAVSRIRIRMYLQYILFGSRIRIRIRVNRQIRIRISVQKPKPDPDPHQSKNSGAMEAQNRTMEKGRRRSQWRLKIELWRVCRPVIADEGHGSVSGSASASKWKFGSRSRSDPRVKIGSGSRDLHQSDCDPQH